MRYDAYFADTNNHKYKITLITNNSTANRKVLTLSDNPCTIEQTSNGLFSPIKSRSCSIEYITQITDDLTDLYTIENHGVKAFVYEAIDDANDIDDVNNISVVFQGYVTPCSYNQPWIGVDNVTIEAVDAISTLKNIKYTVVEADDLNTYPNPTAQFIQVDQLISRLLKKAGLSGEFYYPSTIKMQNNSSTKILSLSRVMESNFFDDDDERTPWSCYQVIEEICKYFGWTLIPYKNSIYIVDYDNLTSNYWYYNLNGNTTSVTLSSITTITGNNLITGDSDYLGDDANYSYDEVHSKITISQNAYDIEEIVTDPFDEINLDCISTKEGLGSGSVKWTQTKTSWFKKKTTTKGYDYSIFYQLKPESGWTHHFWDPTSSNQEIPNYNSGKYGSAKYRVNKILSAKGALIQKSAGYSGSDATIRPTSLGWNNNIAFFCFNDSLADFSPHYVSSKALTYNSKDKLRYSPSGSEDKTWIMITGDLWYQTYVKKKYDVWNDTENIYAVCPSEHCGMESVEVSAKNSIGGSETSGYPCVKYQLRIGDKYWNGSNWTTTASTFNIYYGSKNDDETGYKFKLFEWMPPVNNHDYTDKVGDDCWAIPITKSDNIEGDLEFNIWTPEIYYPGLDYAKWHATPVVYMKNFSLGFKFSDQTIWYLSDTEENNDDIVFSGENNKVNIVAEDLDTELKINSFVNENPLQSRLSKSHILSYTDYLPKLSANNDVYRYQENNLVDKYLRHFGSVKRVYEATVVGRNIINTKEVVGANYPYNYYNFTAIGDQSSRFIIDTYSWNLQNKQNTIKFIEY